MSKKIRVLVIGCGNMGASHATAYHNHEGFEICGLVSRGESKDILNTCLLYTSPSPRDGFTSRMPSSA